MHYKFYDIQRQNEENKNCYLMCQNWHKILMWFVSLTHTLTVKFLRPTEKYFVYKMTNIYIQLHDKLSQFILFNSKFYIQNEM